MPQGVGKQQATGAGELVQVCVCTVSASLCGVDLLSVAATCHHSPFLAEWLPYKKLEDHFTLWGHWHGYNSGPSEALQSPFFLLKKTFATGAGH